MEVEGETPPKGARASRHNLYEPIAVEKLHKPLLVAATCHTQPQKTNGAQASRSWQLSLDMNRKVKLCHIGVYQLQCSVEAVGVIWLVRRNFTCILRLM